jgi:radical SAM superfamily enzyme YgiQ (UPF0313 family)
MYVKFVHSELQALGIEYLSAVLKQHGHRTQLIVDPFFPFVEKIGTLVKILTNHRQILLKKIFSGGPDLIAFSVTSYNMEWACDLAAEIKKHSTIPIIFGGMQATLMPETIFAKSGADFIILGEGEEPLCELVNSLAHNKVNLGMNNLCFNKNGQVAKNPMRDLISDLDTLPYSDKELLPFWLNNGLYRIITGRGCSGGCSYCCVPTYKKIYAGKGHFIRRRSVNNVIKELKYAKTKYKIKRVLFEDDAFIYDKEWLKEFSEHYKEEISVPCLIHAIPETIDERAIAFLKDMMCFCVEIGVQSINEKIREAILLRHDSNEQIKRAISLFKKNSINCICDNILGIPGTDKNDIIQLVKFYNEFRPGKIEILLLEFYPQAAIIEKDMSPKEILKKIERHGFAISECKDLIASAKISLLIGLIYIFPPGIILFILKKKLYRFFPYIKNFNYINEMFFYFMAFFKGNKRKPFISYRADIFLKFRYLLSDAFA